MDFWHKELALKAELLTCLNEAQFTKAIKEAEVHHATTAIALQQTHMDSVLVLECVAKATEVQECQAFLKAFGVAMQACPPETHGTFLYPLQPLTGDVLLAAILGMAATVQL